MRLLDPGRRHYSFAQRVESPQLAAVQPVQRQMDCAHYQLAKLEAVDKRREPQPGNFRTRKDFVRSVGLGNRLELAQGQKHWEWLGKIQMLGVLVRQETFRKPMELALGLEWPEQPTVVRIDGNRQD